MIEHLTETNTHWHNYHSFGMNFGAMMSFGMTPGLINGMMAVPVVRKSTLSSVHENYAQSGMHIKENHINIGKKIEIKPELENHEYLKVRDTAPISSIGSIMAGVQEIKDLYSGIHGAVNTVDADADYESISDAFEEYIQRKNANKKDDIINALKDNGASESDITTVFAALNLDENIDKSTRLQAAHGAIYFEFENEGANKSYRESETQKLLTSALNLFSEAGICIGNLAEEHPDLLNYSLIAMQLACCGPSRLVLDFCTRETGVQEQIDGFKESVYGWVSDKIEDYFEVDHGTAEFLTSSGRFGASFALVGCGLQNKDEIVKEAKNVVEKGVKKFGRQKITVKVSEKELKKFGVKRKIEQIKEDSRLGRNKLTKPNRDVSVTKTFRNVQTDKLVRQGKDPKILKKVDADHIHELQLGGKDVKENIQFLDKGVNRALGRRINQATKDLPKDTKLDVEFIVKESGENL